MVFQLAHLCAGRCAELATISYQIGKHDCVDWMSNVNAAVGGSDGCEEQEEDEELGGHESQMADL